jgi:hypothetical protein
LTASKRSSSVGRVPVGVERHFQDLDTYLRLGIRKRLLAFSLQDELFMEKQRSVFSLFSSDNHAMTAEKRVKLHQRAIICQEMLEISSVLRVPVHCKNE